MENTLTPIELTAAEQVERDRRLAWTAAFNDKVNADLKGDKVAAAQASARMFEAELEGGSWEVAD